MRIMRYMAAMILLWMSIFGCAAFAEANTPTGQAATVEAASGEIAEVEKSIWTKRHLQNSGLHNLKAREELLLKEMIAAKGVLQEKIVLPIPEKALLKNKMPQKLTVQTEMLRNSCVWEIWAEKRISEHLYTIVTNPGENSATEMNINFHADLGFEKCFVEYTEAGDRWWKKASVQSGNYTAYGYDSSVNPFYVLTEESNYKGNVFLDYSVTLENLQPETQYMYRIFDGKNYSEKRYFKTAGADEWSFVVTGDFHEYKKGYVPSRASNAAMAIEAAVSLAKQLEMPEVEHIVAVGDVVAYGSSYTQWQQLYEQPFIRNYSFANAIGNHDATSPSGRRSGKHAAICSNYPLNGAEEQEGISYYYLRGNILFICLTYWENPVAAQAWVNDVLSLLEGKYRYSVLVNHYSPLSKYSGGGFAEFWTDWSAFCDEKRIDLVLTGDHHVYMRSYPLYEGAIVENYSAANPNGTVYITADSADGDRGSTKEEVAKNWKTHVAAKYYRYMYGGTSHDITSILISVSEEKMTVRFVYYEDRRTAEKSSAFCEGSVDGKEFFFYGDTSYIYPSAH